MCITVVSRDIVPPQSAEELYRKKQKIDSMKDEFRDRWDDPPDILYDSVR